MKSKAENNIPNNPIDLLSNAMGNIIPDNIVDGEATEIPDEPIPEEVPSMDPNLGIVTEPTPIPPAVTDEEFIPEPEDDAVKIIKVAPMGISNKVKGQQNIATLSFICVDNKENVFTIHKNYIIDSLEEEEKIKELPIYNGDFYNTFKLSNSVINNHLEAYVTEFKFTVPADFQNINDIEFRFAGTNSKDSVNHEFKVNGEVFMSFAFLDSYILEAINNQHDFELAISLGYGNGYNSASSYLVENIDNIVAMAPGVADRDDKFLDKLKGAFKKKEDITTIALEFKSSRIIDGKNDPIFILTPFDIGVTLDESKFKGNTIKDLETKCFGDSDQYICTLMINSIYLLGPDKDYMVLRVKNNKNEVKLVFIDKANMEHLTNLIKEF